MDVEDGVTFLSTTLRALVASCLRRSHEDVEKEKRKLKDSNVAAEIKDTLTLHGSLELFANVIKYFMNEREQESDLERGFRMLAFQTLKDALGSETILLSDFCTHRRPLVTVAVPVSSVRIDSLMISACRE
jgi:hypothetical protein